MSNGIVALFALIGVGFVAACVIAGIYWTLLTGIDLAFRGIVKHYGDQARRQLDAGHRYAVYELNYADQGIYDARPPLRWYHRAAIAMEVRWSRQSEARWNLE